MPFYNRGPLLYSAGYFTASPCVGIPLRFRLVVASGRTNDSQVRMYILLQNVCKVSSHNINCYFSTDVHTLVNDQLQCSAYARDGGRAHHAYDLIGESCMGQFFQGR